MAKSLFRKREVAQYEILALQVDNKRKAVGNQFVSDGFGGQDGKHNHCFIRELAADGKPTPKSYLIGFDGNVIDFYSELNRHVGAVITSSTMGFNTFGPGFTRVRASDMYGSVPNSPLYTLLGTQKKQAGEFKIKSDPNARKLQDAIRSLNSNGYDFSFTVLPDGVFGDTYNMDNITSGKSYSDMQKTVTQKQPPKTSRVINGMIDGQPIADYGEVHNNGEANTSRDVFSNTYSPRYERRQSSGTAERGNYQPRHLPKLPDNYTYESFAGEEALDIG